MEKSTSTATPMASPSADQPPTVAPDLNTSPLPTQPSPPSIPPTDPSSRGKKRLLEKNLQIDNSDYYKLRLLLKDLRPHVLEILRAPDFRNCKGAIEIQEKMKLMMQLYQEMIRDATTKGDKTAKTDSLSNGKYLQNSGGDGNNVGHSMIGGSAFGWNFVTYGGTEAVYCGISKAEYRRSHPINQVEAEVELHKTL